MRLMEHKIVLSRARAPGMESYIFRNKASSVTCSCTPKCAIVQKMQEALMPYAKADLGIRIEDGANGSCAYGPKLIFASQSLDRRVEVATLQCTAMRETRPVPAEWHSCWQQPWARKHRPYTTWCCRM